MSEGVGWHFCSYVLVARRQFIACAFCFLCITAAGSPSAAAAAFRCGRHRRHQTLCMSERVKEQCMYPKRLCKTIV